MRGYAPDPDKRLHLRPFYPLGHNPWQTYVPRLYASMDWVGIEPTTFRASTERSTKLSYQSKERMGGGRFELPNPKERVYSPSQLATLLTSHDNNCRTRTRTEVSGLWYRRNYRYSIPQSMWPDRVELSCLVPQTSVLPLDYVHHYFFMKTKVWFEPTENGVAIRCVRPLRYFA